MKKSICIAASLLALGLAPVWGQPTTPAPPTPPQAQIQRGVAPPPLSPEAQIIAIEAARAQPAASAAEPSKFDLDFPGGTPADLIEAIEDATHKQLNVVILNKDANAQLPRIKLKHISVPALFSALAGVTEQTDSDYLFSTRDPINSDDAIWFFSVSKAPPSTTTCRYYFLESYLDKGLTVDDITTAIKSGWDMQHIDPQPRISFHKETKLLIAVGDSNQLDAIDAVLKALQPSKYKLSGAIDPETGLPVTKDKATGAVDPNTGLPATK